MPSSAFRFAPSPYTRPPPAWTISAIRAMCDSNSPSVLGLVTISAATSGVITASMASGWRMPSSPEGTAITS
jgi:hypothetical protein